jgi:RNA polymerase sigma-70 factor (ECF subfamily)
MSGFEVAFGEQAPRSDAELIAGSRADFGVLFDRYAARIYQYCVHRVGQHLAEDVVAETFLVAYERRHRYDPRRPVAGPWLYGIATNLVRRRRAARARDRRWVADLAGPDPAERVAERADAEVLVRSLADALAGLPRRQLDVLYLLMAGLRQDEVAAALDISPATVRSRLHRARIPLRQALIQLGVPPDVGRPIPRGVAR